MRIPLILAVLLAAVAVGGIAFYGLTAPGAVPAGSTQAQPTSNQASPSNLDYACEKPAVNTQNFCDKLPAGYQIAPRLPNAPAPSCRAGMTTSACQLLQKTYANGVCDPNETASTDPLDCGCTGALVGDPYTGRCGLAASVCQQQHL